MFATTCQLGTSVELRSCCECRPDFVIDTTFELFCELGASDEQCDFPAVYASGVNGTAGTLPDSLASDLEPLFEAIVKEIKPPSVKLNSPLQMLVTNLDYDDHKGRIAIGRVSSGCISRAEQVSYLKPGTPCRPSKANTAQLGCRHVHRTVGGGNNVAELLLPLYCCGSNGDSAVVSCCRCS